MRASLLLLTFLCACTVVPTPTTSSTTASDPNLVGTWRTVTNYNADSLVQRLAIFSDGSYERGAVDSSPITGNRLVLSEMGVWSFLADTTRIVFSPYARQIWSSASAVLTPTATTVDTAVWTRSNDTLSFTLRRWYQRDSLESLVYRRD
jgi:hypothetical protein